MAEPIYHPLAEGHFSYLAVQGEQCELKIDNQITVFNLQTAEELCDLLRGYIEDRHRCRVEYLTHADDAEQFFQFIQARREP